MGGVIGLEMINGNGTVDKKVAKKPNDTRNEKALKNMNDNWIEWEKFKFNKDGEAIPLKVWQNLRCMLEQKGIKVSLNLIDHEIDYTGLEGSSLRNGRITDIHAMQISCGLNLSRDELVNCIQRVAEENAYNPFVDMLKANKNNDYKIIYDVFNLIGIQADYEKYSTHYASLFVKWCLNVVKMAQNTLQNDFSAQGVLVLQGEQGCFKSTFARKLMPNKVWYKGDKSLEPNSVDSVMQNTKYILVEWGELDSTLKGEQAKLKQFITATNDEYRVPYARVAEKFPRVTSYIGTVNKKDFLKDETGSRRFWIIPVEKCDHEALDNIDMAKFWGAVYGLYLEGKVVDYITEDERRVLNELNKGFNYQTDISIILDEQVDWSTDKEKWKVYNASEVCEKLMIRELKSLKIELEKRDIPYKLYNIGGTKRKRGYKLPNIDFVGCSSYQ